MINSCRRICKELLWRHVYENDEDFKYETELWIYGDIENIK